jgi:hypothetical protein
VMRFVCDAPDGKTWFQIETEAEAALESNLMQHAVEKHFRQAREHAKMSYVPPSGAYIEREVGAFINEQRLWTNLLSSEPLTFNLFGPLRLRSRCSRP